MATSERQMWHRRCVGVFVCVGLSVSMLTAACGAGHDVHQPLHAQATDGVAADGFYATIDLDDVVALDVKGREVLLTGGLGRVIPSPQGRVATVRRYPLTQVDDWHDATADWVYDPMGPHLLHRRSGTKVRLNMPRGSANVVFKASRVGSAEYVVVFASGDWKVGPNPSYWGQVHVRGGRLEVNEARPR